MDEQYNNTICILDKEYIKETLLLLHATINRGDEHSNSTLKRFQNSIKILDDLKYEKIIN